MSTTFNVIQVPPHTRKLVRHEVVRYLSTPIVPGNPAATPPVLPTYLTSAGPNVVASRVQPTRHEQMPMISVYTRFEDVNPNDSEPQPFTERTLDVGFDLFTTGDSEAEIDDQIDDLCAEIEHAFQLDTEEQPNPVLPFFEATWFRPRQTNILILDEGKKLTGTAILLYRGRYRGPNLVREEDLMTTPTRVFVSFAPEIGPAHKDKYRELGTLAPGEDPVQFALLRKSQSDPLPTMPPGSIRPVHE